MDLHVRSKLNLMQGRKQKQGKISMHTDPKNRSGKEYHRQTHYQTGDSAKQFIPVNTGLDETWH